MALVKTKGLVIREKPYQEQSKMLTIFTEKEGKIQAIAHNAKGVRSQLAESTQLFAYSRFNYYKGKNFANINNADSVHSFYKLRDDLKKMTLGSYILELVDLLYEWYQGDAQTLRLIIHALYYLDKCKEGHQAYSSSLYILHSVLILGQHCLPNRWFHALSLRYDLPGHDMLFPN